jgi:HSP20 family protein
VTDEDYYCCERGYGKFNRAITRPTDVETGKIAATYRNGVLEAHLPKAKEGTTKKREIQIQ